jgi:hypothetical protein
VFLAIVFAFDIEGSFLSSCNSNFISGPHGL